MTLEDLPRPRALARSGGLGDGLVQDLVLYAGPVHPLLVRHPLGHYARRRRGRDRTWSVRRDDHGVQIVVQAAADSPRIPASPRARRACAAA